MALFVFVTQTMFSMLVFRCRGPGDTTSKVSCCVKPSYCFKNSKCPCTPLKISLPKNKTMVNLKSASFIIIMLWHEGLTSIANKALVCFWREFHFNNEWVKITPQYEVWVFLYIYILVHLADNTLYYSVKCLSAGLYIYLKLLQGTSLCVDSVYKSWE